MYVRMRVCVLYAKHCLFINSTAGPVSWGCRIRQLYLSREVRPHHL